MKLRLFLLLSSILLLVSCDGIGGGNDRGSGNVISEEREVSGFDRVLVSGSGVAEIIQGESESLMVEAEDNIMPYVESEVENGVLVLSQRANLNLIPTKPVRYTITMVDVAGLEVSGSGTINAEQIDGTIVAFGISGSGEINVTELDGDSAEVKISGSGNAQISGDVADQVVEISGSGDYRAGDLRSATAVVTIGGSGDATVWVDTTLEINVGGSGSVSYYGDPILTESVSGSGDVRSLGAKG